MKESKWIITDGQFIGIVLFYFVGIYMKKLGDADFIGFLLFVLVGFFIFAYFNKHPKKRGGNAK